MGAIRDRIQQMNIQATSSDETVHARLSTGRGIEVSFEPWVLEEYDEQTLAHEIEEALTSVVTGAREYAEEIKTGRNSRPPEDRTSRENAVEKAISNIDITAESPRRLLTIDWMGEADFVVTFHAKAFDKLDHEALTRDVNATIFAVSHLRRQETIKIHRNNFQRQR